ncbi:hypothetical protein LB410_07200 [Escherichia coli]
MADESGARKKELIIWKGLQRVIDKGFVMIYLLAVCGIRKRAHTGRALFSLQAGFNVAVYIAYKN